MLEGSEILARRIEMTARYEKKLLINTKLAHAMITGTRMSSLQRELMVMLHEVNNYYGAVFDVRRDKDAAVMAHKRNCYRSIHTYI